MYLSTHHLSSNVIYGIGTWPQTSGHMVHMTSMFEPMVLPNIDLEIPAGHNIDLELPAGHNIDLEIVV